MSDFIVPLGALVNVGSLDRSVAFYTAVLGLEVQVREQQVAILAEAGGPIGPRFALGTARRPTSRA